MQVPSIKTHQAAVRELDFSARCLVDNDDSTRCSVALTPRKHGGAEPSAVWRKSSLGTQSLTECVGLSVVRDWASFIPADSATQAKREPGGV